MIKKKAAKLIIKDSFQDDCHYAFYIKDSNGKFIARFTTEAGWDGDGLARWQGMPVKIDEDEFHRCLKNGGIPKWVADLYIEEGGFLCNRDLKKIASETNVIVFNYNDEEPWIYV